MIGIGKNHYKAIVTIATLTSILIVNAMTIGGHIALARHQDTIKAFENSYINMQTDTNQGQACETASGTSPISGSCTASSTDTQGSSSQGLSSPTTHPTVLTLNLPNPAAFYLTGAPVILTGTLTDIRTGMGIPGATITFTGTGTFPPLAQTVTNDDRTFMTSFPANPPGGTVQAHFRGQGIFGPSNSAREIFTVR